MKLPVSWKEGELRELQYEGKDIGISVQWSNNRWIVWGKSITVIYHDRLLNNTGFAKIIKSTDFISDWSLKFSFLKWEWKARPAKVEKERIRRIEAKLKHT